MTQALAAYAAAKSYVQAMALQMSNPARLGLVSDAVLVLPFLMLAGFAVELYYKAFLLHAGLTDDQLRSQALRHDLDALAARCEAYGFVVPEAKSLVAILHDKHKSHEFRYMKGDGEYSLMPPHQFFSALTSLDNAVDAAVGASASRGIEPGGAWALAEDFASWRR